MPRSCRAAGWAARSTRVAARRGGLRCEAAILVVDSAAIARDGHAFRLSPNGVWLVDRVPPRYLRVLDEAERLER